MRIVVVSRFAAALLLVFAGPALAQGNLLTNSGFDSVVTGWSQVGTGAVQFSPLDAAAKPNSGSLLLTNSNPATTLTYALQCLALSGTKTYYAAASVRIPSGQAQTGYAYVTPQWYSQPGCGGSPITAQFTSNVSAFDTWTRVSVVAPTPVGA